MCGRFAIVSPVRELIEAFGLMSAPDTLEARYNLAPTQLAPVVLNRPERSLEMLRWGLVPSWAKDVKIGSRMINARAETLAEKPSFKKAFKHRRCLVPADGFYEWKKTGGTKVPHLIRRKDGSPMALAGLWEVWERGERPLCSFTIVTTTPNRLMSELHHRMPVVLSAEHWDRWLAPDPVDPAKLVGLLRPLPDGLLQVQPVRPEVGSPANDGPQLWEPA